MNLRLRPIVADDMPFLQRVYAGTRADEMALVPWTEAEKQQFVLSQFEAQHEHYQEHYQGASFDVILDGDEPVGRLYVDRRPAEIRVIDIALLPERRGHGIGSTFMGELLEEAEGAGLRVTIHVESNNRALAWYQRLGFRQIGEHGIYLLMEWRKSGKLPQ